MSVLTIQVHHNVTGWMTAAALRFIQADQVELEYDVDYAAQYIQRLDRYALSVQYPVDLTPYRGPVPGFVLDLIPQGEPLKRLLGRYQIKRDDQYAEILHRIPLASPGNMRILEPWQEIESQRPSYRHQGFTREDIAHYKSDFTHYMETIGAPIGGTSGAGGGSPKFLLREDDAGRFHAEGMLDDSKTKRAYLVKFPYTDSQNSVLLSRVEKVYYDLIQELPLKSGATLEIQDDVLFIPRFDRERDESGRLCYHGLESLYSAHNINYHGAYLTHEKNLQLLWSYSTQPELDVLEYTKRDWLNQMLANSDNHGRNTSLIKKEYSIALSPLYDVTAMEFFRSDHIVSLTRWTQDYVSLKSQLRWIRDNFNLDQSKILETVREFFEAVKDIEQKMKAVGVPDEIILPSRDSRSKILQEIAAVMKQGI